MVVWCLGQPIEDHPGRWASFLPESVMSDHDRIIPVAHTYRAAEATPGDHLEILERAGHFLPWRNADKFLAVLEDFPKSTTPAHVPEERWRKLLTSAPPNDEQE